MPPPNFHTSALYALDNLEVMRGMDSATVHLIYADPPFNSKRIYQGMPGTKAAPHRFRDTWSWNDAKEEWLDQLENDWPTISQLITVAKAHSGGMAGYLAFMSVRVIEMHRILRNEGSLYLHCDPTAGAYLRNLLDCVFGAQNFRNEIVWQRKVGVKHNLARKRMPSSHDNVLYYVRSSRAAYQPQFTPYSDEYLNKTYKHTDQRGRYATFPCTNDAGGNKTYTFRGITRAWRFAPETMQQMYDDGLLVQATADSPFRYKKYLGAGDGVKVDDCWIDIPQVGGHENTGWQTQKPLSLLERIIKGSSSEGDIVFDPFCGCGTALVAAETLGRRWVGADDDANAVDVIRERLANLTGGVTDAPQMQNPVDVLYRPPQRTIVENGKVLQDPTGTIVARKPSDRMTNREIRARLEEWQTENDGLITCPACTERLKPRHFHVDHINPKSLGGRNRIDNRILICGACNLDKSNTNTIAELWKEHGIRGKQRQQQQAYLKDLQLKADALINHLDAADPPAPQLPMPHRQ